MALQTAPGPADASLAAWSRAVAPRLQQHSGGNPLLLTSLLGSLGVDWGARPDEATITAHARQATAEAAARRILATLPTAAQRALAVAAAVGTRPDLATISAALDQDAGTCLTGPAEAGLVTIEHAAVAFTHPTYREAALRLVLTPSQRRRIAEVLEARGHSGDPAAALEHLRLAGSAAPVAQLTRVARAAAEAASAVGDHLAAARALDALAERGATTVEALLAAAEAYHLAGEREHAWQRARDAGDPTLRADAHQLARAALLLARGQEFVDDQTEAVTQLRTAAGLLDEGDPLLAEVLAVLARLTLEPPLPGEATIVGPGAAQRWDVDTPGARALAARARALADGGDRRATAALTWRETHTDPACHDQRRAASDEALEAAETPGLGGRAHLLAALDALEAADRDRCDDLLTRARAMAERSGDLDLRWRVALLDAALLRASGRRQQALAARAEAAAAGARAAEPGAPLADLGQDALLALDDDLHGPTPQRLIDAGADISLASFRAGRGLMLALRGDAEQALAIAIPLVAELTDDRDREGAWLVSMTLLADAIATAARADLAEPPVDTPVEALVEAPVEALVEPLVEALEPFAGLIAVDLIDGFAVSGCAARPLARLLALQGRHDEAAERFALARHRDGQAGLDLYRCHGDIDERSHAHAHGAAIGAATARRLAADAKACGAPVLQARAAMLALPTGDPVVVRRQRGVLRGLAAGHTYQRIASDLGYAPSTVNKDAMRLYRALGVSGRRSAVDAARRLGLLDGGDGRVADAETARSAGER